MKKPPVQHALPQVPNAPEQTSDPSSKNNSSAPLSLSARTPEELMAMSFSSSDIYLGDGVIAKGQGAVILGPGGVGKSTLITQLAFAQIIGQPFLGLPTGCANKKCLLLQAENSNWRLSTQFKKQLGASSATERKRISDHLHVHTLEHAHDTRLRLNGSASSNAIARLINKVAPDVLFIDPLNAFAKGSLNSDDGMLATLHEFENLAKQANPDATVIVVHHTRTDSKAYRDAVGQNRGSYGRGSKALHGWSRGTINIAPGDPADPGKIMIACGKNSNGREFHPFGAVLNTATMLYEVDPNFDLDTWKRKMCGEGGGSLALSPQRVAEYVEHRPLKKVDLVAEIMRETGCQKTKAYEAISLAENSTIIRNETREYRAIKVRD
jgi:hypothetical protein